jgi:NhaP-type Na+/H+ and K+/H+ antiporter
MEFEKPLDIETNSTEKDVKEFEKIDEYFELLDLIVGSKEKDEPGLDKLLSKVLQRHEEDFFNAFNTHISKVKRELEYLKHKADEQEEKMIEDERIVNLQKHLHWFLDENERLKTIKEK